MRLGTTLFFRQRPRPACAQQSPPEQSTVGRLVRIVHPHHPRFGQLVRVVRQAGHPAYPEGQWVIELDEQTHASIPLSWAVLEDELPPGSLEPPPGSPDRWADVASLLNLATMVHKIMASLPVEVTARESPICPPSVDSPSAPVASAPQRSPRLGRSPSGAPARTGGDSDRDVAQATTSDPPAAGGAPS